jgi:hypothetical protein
MDKKYYYYQVSKKPVTNKRDGVWYTYYSVSEVPCDYETARAKAEKQKQLIKIIDDLRRST